MLTIRKPVKRKPTKIPKNIRHLGPLQSNFVKLMTVHHLQKCVKIFTLPVECKRWNRHMTRHIDASMVS